MITITLVGTGTVSKHLQRVFSRTQNIEVLNVLPSRQLELKNEDITQHPDVYIIAVSDDAIHSVSQKLTQTKSLVVHTSGSVSLNALPHSVNRGIFYPLQTFSKEREIDFTHIPICLEAENEEALKVLRNLASAISKSVYELNSEQRRAMHLAAVFVNNFTNHLYEIGHDICITNGLDFNILKPLITETAKKIETLPPAQAQTGPAKRNDIEVIEKHKKLLKEDLYLEIYTLITQSIQKKYGKEL